MVDDGTRSNLRNVRELFPGFFLFFAKWLQKKDKGTSVSFLYFPKWQGYKKFALSELKILPLFSFGVWTLYRFSSFFLTIVPPCTRKTAMVQGKTENTPYFFYYVFFRKMGEKTSDECVEHYLFFTKFK